MRIFRFVKRILYRLGILKSRRFVSKGEQTVETFLKKHKIKYIPQYKLSDVHSTVRKYFLVDFYLPKNNLFIEYNGRQHYMPVEFFGGESAFIKQSIRDEELRNYCRRKNINLLEIPYSAKLTDSYLSKVIYQKLISFKL